MSEPPASRLLPTRVSAACDRCRRNKSRCDPHRPCSLCVRANVECLTESNLASRPQKRKRRSSPSHVRSEEAPTLRQDEVTCSDASVIVSQEPSRRGSVVEGEADSAMGIAQRIYQLGSRPSLHTTSAIPGGIAHEGNQGPRPDRVQRRPTEIILGYPLPSSDIMRMLVEEYFDTVHWFSLVIFEPRFRPKFEAVQDGQAQPSQKGFLLLLSVVLGMGAWYKSQRNRIDQNFQGEDWQGWAAALIQGAGSHLIEMMDQTSIASAQACILLGSYYLYHGKPNLSFALLGATIRTAQAIGLHRQPLRGDPNIIEERKRVWWTIYTWDRFASITYGRPLGINDKDCTITDPIDTSERPYFLLDQSSNQDSSICYSTYQRELNRLYRAASPVIEVVFGLRATGSGGVSAAPQYMQQVMEATEKLWAWRRHLPSQLLLDLRADCPSTQSRASKVHRLQALSLQLTFDSLVIIFYRPLLAQQIDNLIQKRPDGGNVAMHSPSALSETSSLSLGVNPSSPLSQSGLPGTEQWWDAAVRTSRVTEMPQLAQLATESHLVAFLAINLFNSAIVMAVLALSDPLSDRAQKVKRTVTRIFRLQEVLSRKTQLSMQSNIVLKDIIQMLLRREQDAMLGAITTGSDQTEAPLMSVEETLRLPMQVSIGTESQLTSRHRSTAEKVMRLNESLISVQRAFPSGFDSGINQYHANSQQWPEGEQIAHAIPQSSPHEFTPDNTESFSLNNDSDWNDNAISDITNNSLYWFWDSTWTEGQF